VSACGRAASLKEGFRTDVRVKLWVLDGPWNCLEDAHDVMSDETLRDILAQLNTNVFSTPDARMYLWLKFQDIGRVSVLAEKVGWRVARVPLVVVYKDPVVKVRETQFGRRRYSNIGWLVLRFFCFDTLAQDGKYQNSPRCRAYPVLFLYRGVLGKSTRHLLDSRQDHPLFNVIEVNAPKSRATGVDGKVLRKEEKPVDAYLEFILRDSEPGDFVGDLFCGSGTIAAAALLAHRRVVVGDADVACVRAAVTRAAATLDDISSGRVELQPYGHRHRATADELKSLAELPPPSATKRKVVRAAFARARVSDFIDHIVCRSRNIRPPLLRRSSYRNRPCLTSTACC
jgi:hypothetical protein